MLGRICVVGLCVIGIFCGVTQGRTVYVDHNADGSNDGTTWGDAYTTLQDALADNGTPAVTEILVAQGTYKPSSQSSSFALRNGLKIDGGYNAALEVQDWTLYATYLSGDIDGDDVHGNWSNYDDNCYNVLKAENVGSTAKLNGFYITGGNNTESGAQGGGLYLINASPQITNCKFENNEAYAAGAVYILGETGHTAAPTFTDCQFEHNRAYGTNLLAGNGGAVYCSLNTSGTVFSGCVFLTNSSVTGGGAVAVLGDSDAYFVNCEFNVNRAINEAVGGGAVYVGQYERNGHVYGDAGNPIFMNCTFVGNEAPNGGGFCSTNDLATQSSGDGPQIINCSFSYNKTSGTTGYGGGMIASSNDLTNYYPRVYNSIFWKNTHLVDTHDEDAQIYVGQSLLMLDVQHTFIEDCVTVSGGFCYDPSDDNIGDVLNSVPEFVSTPSPSMGDYGNLRLGSTSICVEAGDNDKIADDLADFAGDGHETVGSTPIDLDEEARTLDGDNNGTATVDMGAYESFLDCNSNGIPDECDIAYDGACTVYDAIDCGTSYDCNEDGVPDDCCPWDLDFSGFVGTGDINLTKAKYGCDMATLPYCLCEAFDLDGSGVIGTGDVNVIKANYGACP